MALLKKKKGKKPQKIDRTSALPYDYHLSVLLKGAVDNLVVEENGIYIDGTLGGGGHTAEILKRITDGGKVLAFDKDPDAIEHTSRRFSDLINTKLIIYNECYSEACSKEELHGKINGLLLDLGVSSRQLDDSNRGISYRQENNLDMRFGTSGRTAKELLLDSSEQEIERIIRLYGEEPFSRVIARRIVEMRRVSSLNTTFDLRNAITQAVPIHLQSKAITRVFQAIRIAVNSELEVLENTLTNIVPMMKSGGRIVVISYHSLEDKIVKSIFKELAKKNRPSETDEEKLKSNFVPIIPKIKILTNNPIIPSDEEIKYNPRARSAKMRIAEII